jgi:hypothetical protein
MMLNDDDAMMLLHAGEVFTVTFYGDQATHPLEDETETES